MADPATRPGSTSHSYEAFTMPVWPRRAPPYQEIAVFFVRLIAALLLAILLSGCQDGPPVVRTPDGFDPPYNYY